MIVTPSVYGTDNSATLFGIKARGADRARGRRDRRENAGRRSRRHERRRAFAASGSTSKPAASTMPLQAAGALRPRSSASETQLARPAIHVVAMIAAIKDLVAASPVPVVFDHFGGAQAELGTGAAGFCRPARTGEVGRGLCENLRRLSGVKTARPIFPTRPRWPAP